MLLGITSLTLKSVRSLCSSVFINSTYNHIYSICNCKPSAIPKNLSNLARVILDSRGSMGKPEPDGSTLNWIPISTDFKQVHVSCRFSKRAHLNLNSQETFRIETGAMAQGCRRGMSSRRCDFVWMACLRHDGWRMDARQYGIGGLVGWWRGMQFDEDDCSKSCSINKKRTCSLQS